MEKILRGRSYCRKSDVFLADMGGDGMVLLDADQDSYFQLNSTGAAIWRELDSPATPEELVDKLIQAYQIEEEPCFEEVTSLLQVLLKNGLLESREGT